MQILHREHKSVSEGLKSLLIDLFAIFWSFSPYNIRKWSKKSPKKITKFEKLETTNAW